MFVVGSVLVDTSDLPVVMLTERGAEASVPDFLSAFAQLLRTQASRFVSVHDVRTVHGWDVPERVVVHAWLDDHAAVLSKLVVAHATIVTGIKQRTMAGAVYWATKFERNVTCFEDVETAVRWGHKMAAAGNARRGSR